MIGWVYDNWDDGWGFGTIFAILLVGGVIAWAIWSDQRAQQKCERSGGTYEVAGENLGHNEIYGCRR